MAFTKEMLSRLLHKPACFQGLATNFTFSAYANGSRRTGGLSPSSHDPARALGPGGHGPWPSKGRDFTQSANRGPEQTLIQVRQATARPAPQRPAAQPHAHSHTAGPHAAGTHISHDLSSVTT